MIVAICWWYHAAHLKARCEREISNFRIYGFKYQLVDQITEKAIPTLAQVQLEEPIYSYQGSVSGSKQRVVAEGRWIGKLPQAVTITAPNYKPKTTMAEVYEDKIEILRLEPVTNQ